MFLWPVFRRVQNLRRLQILCSRDRRCWAANTSRKSGKEKRPAAFSFAKWPSLILSDSWKTLPHNPGSNPSFWTCPAVRKKLFYIPLKSFSWFCEEASCWDIQRCVYNILETCYFCSLQKDKEQQRLLNIFLFLFINAVVTKICQKSFINEGNSFFGDQVQKPISVFLAKLLLLSKTRYFAYW